jgi:quercetin dioxygenase-like cupin family protein
MDIEHIFCGGLYAKKCYFKRGEVGHQHSHTFEHLSIVASGFVRVERDGVPAVEYGPGDTIQIAAETVHRVTALTDATWLCLWPDNVGDDDHARQDESVIASATPKIDPS